MRPRAEAGLALALFAAGLLIVGIIGRQLAPKVETDTRPSSFLRGPNGTSALAEALTTIHLRVDRLRARPTTSNLTATDSQRTVLLLLGPRTYVPSAELAAVTNAALSDRGMAVIAAAVNGTGLSSCFGYDQDVSVIDSVLVREPGRPDWRRPVWVNTVLHYSVRDSVRTRIDLPFEEADPCLVLPNLATDGQVTHDTLLADARGRPVMVRMHGGSLVHDLILVSDVKLFRNRTLRDTDAGLFLLTAIRDRYDRVLIDEYHQGFGESGSLGSEVLSWSLASPWGWGAWQVAVVALLALLASAIRFGPVEQLPRPRRRSPQEHVRALATALASARGHQIAAGRLILGLRRRLTPGGRAPRAKWRPWLQQFAQHATKPETRAAAERLLALASDTSEPERVMRVAHAVEDVWTTMRR